MTIEEAKQYILEGGKITEEQALSLANHPDKEKISLERIIHLVNLVDTFQTNLHILQGIEEVHQLLHW